MKQKARLTSGTARAMCVEVESRDNRAFDHTTEMSGASTAFMPTTW